MRDSDIRTLLLASLRAAHANENGTLLVQEMGMLASHVRVDVAVINGELSGFELKSDRDTLSRLPRQADVYNKVLDRCTIVTGEKYSSAVLRKIPNWWGVYIAVSGDKGRGIQIVRESDFNPSLSSSHIAQLLWRDEALSILERHDLHVGYRSKPIAILHERLAMSLPLDDLRREVRSELKSRKTFSGKGVGNYRDVPVHSN